MKPCWRRWATSQGCFSLLSVSLSTAGLPSDSSGRLLFLPDHFWRRNLPDCTAGSGPLALRSVGELNCHCVQTTLVRLRAPERVAEQERGIRLMLMKCTSTVCQFVLSHAQGIIYTHWNLKCQISEKREWLQMRTKSEMIYLGFSDLRVLRGLHHCADELFALSYRCICRKKIGLKTFWVIVTIKWIIEILTTTLLASLKEQGPFYWSQGPWEGSASPLHSAAFYSLWISSHSASCSSTLFPQHGGHLEF